MSFFTHIEKSILLFKAHHKKVFFAILLVLLLENMILVYDNIQNKTPILGLKVSGKFVLFSSRSQIQHSLVQKDLQNVQPLRFQHGNQIIEVNQKDLKANVDPYSFSNEVLQVGRSGNVLEKLIIQNKALFGLINVPIHGTISQALLTIVLLDIQDRVNKGAKPKLPDFANNSEVLLPEQNGVKVNTDKLSLLILAHIFEPPKEALLLPTITTFPNSYDLSDIQKLKEEYAKNSFAQISIASGGIIFTLSSADLKTLVKVVERPDPKNSKKGKLSLRLDAVALDKKLGDFAQKVEDITHAEFDHHDALIAIYSQFFSNTRRLIAIPTGRSIVYKKVLGAKTQNDPNIPKTAYLTFDDGPNAIYHPLILDILKTFNVKATFFLVGQNVQRSTDVAKRTVSEGHALGNHSLTHSFLPNYSSSFILNELQSTNTILKPIIGYDTKLFRPPYGGVNSYVTQNAQAAGLKMYLWDVDPRDWSEPATEELVNRVVNNTFDGADILLHSNHLATVKALPKIIAKLQAQGYKFKTLNN